MKKVFLIAPPAAGKGTQASLIAKNYNLPHISTGQLLRDEVINQTEIGNLIKQKMTTGELIDDQIVKELLIKRFKQADCDLGFVLEGFPRNLDQVKILEELKVEIPYVIWLDLDKEIAKKRVLGRLVCQNCKANFNIYFEDSKPKIEKRCDYCGGNLIKRPDDNQQTFLERLNVYENETKPVLDYYQTRKKLFRINGNQSVNQVFGDIKKVLDD